MTSTRMVSAVAALLLLGSAGQTYAALPDTPANGWDDYRVLSERNIFLMERSSGARRPPTERIAPTYSPEHYLLLTGIVRQAQEYVAFLEDTRSHSAERVRVNGRVAQGRIARIELDYIEYEVNGETRKVELGKTLEGSEAMQLAPPKASAVTGVPSGEAPTPASSGASSDAAAILERLRQKRLTELNKESSVTPLPEIFQ